MRITERITGLQGKTTVEEKPQVKMKETPLSKDAKAIKEKYILRQEKILFYETSLRGPGDENRLLSQADDATARFLSTGRLFDVVIQNSTWEEEAVRVFGEKNKST